MKAKYEDKKRFIIAKAKKDVFVNALDRFFVDDYAEKFNQKIIAKQIGSDVCPDLSRTLLRMYKEGILKRYAEGCGGLVGMGFPRWTWNYSLKGVYE